MCKLTKEQKDDRKKILHKLIDDLHNTTSNGHKPNIKDFYENKVKHLYSFITYDNFAKTSRRIRQKEENTTTQTRANVSTRSSSSPSQKHKRSDFSENPNSHKNRKNNESPIAQLELFLVGCCEGMSRLNMPYKRNEVLILANDVIKGTHYESAVLAYKKKVLTDESLHVGTLGERWLKGFLKRHADKLKPADSEDFDRKREFVVNTKNIQKMYDLQYEAWVVSGVAEKTEDYIYYNNSGVEVSWEDIVSKKEVQCGRKTKYRLVYAQYVFFFDEVGNNTNTKNDGRIGNTKFIVCKNSRGLRRGSRYDCRWTLLCLTAATGEPIMMVVIIQKVGDLDALEVTGIDITKEKVGQTLKENMGAGKRYPGLKTIVFRNKKIEGMVFRSESGGITPEILTLIFKRLDDLDVFPRITLANGKRLIPTAQIDSHPSRFNLDFVKYINDPNHKWAVELGLPDATHVTQVGDSKEQNGTYKSKSYDEKWKLIKYRHENGLSTELERTDIIPIVNATFAASFGNQEGNKKATRERGWNPMTYNLLDSEEVKRGDGLKEFNTESVLLHNTLNTLARAVSVGGRDTSTRKRKQSSDDDTREPEFLEAGFKLNTNAMYKNNTCSLSEAILDFIDKRAQKNTNKEDDTITKKICKYFDMESKFLEISRDHNTADSKTFVKKVNGKDLDVLIQRKRRKVNNSGSMKDPSPSKLNVAEKRKEYLRICERRDINLFEYLTVENGISRDTLNDLYTRLTGSTNTNYQEHDLKKMAQTYQESQKNQSNNSTNGTVAVPMASI